MKNNIVHICWSPLVGHPLAIVNALNKYTEFNASFINLNIFQRGDFGSDLNWPSDKEKIYQKIEEADIIHFHQTIELDNNILGLNFEKMLGGRKKFIRQFSSDPYFFSNYGMKNYDYFLDEKNVTHVVTGQYHERYYDAIPVPLIIDPNICDRRWPEPNWECPKLCFSPSNDLRINEGRWFTKGKHEFIQIVENLSNKYQFDFDLIEGVTHEEAIQRKSNSTIVIDEMVTGTYHTSALEGLFLGRPTFSYLDSHTIMLLAKLTGATTLPFINSTISNFPKLVGQLIQDMDLCESIGSEAKIWFNEYYHPKKLIQYHAEIYNILLEGKEPRFKRKSSSKGSRYLNIIQYDNVALSK